MAESMEYASRQMVGHFRICAVGERGGGSIWSAHNTMCEGETIRVPVRTIDSLMEDFGVIHEVLARAGFDLFDATELAYAQSGVLGWFYPVYLNARHRDLRPVELWNPSFNDHALELQRRHRADVQESVAGSLSRLRAGEWKPLAQ